MLKLRSLFLDSRAIKVFFKPKIGENIALSAARSTAVLISAMLVHSTSFFPILFRHKAMCTVKSVSDFSRGLVIDDSLRYDPRGRLDAEYQVPIWPISFDLTSPDVILCGRLGSKHQLTNQLINFDLTAVMILCGVNSHTTCYITAIMTLVVLNGVNCHIDRL